MIIDQHAAHERLTLEKMKFARQNKSIERQILLLPEVINLEPVPLEIIKENIELLADIGFVLELFGEGAVVVREIAALLGDEQTFIEIYKRATAEQFGFLYITMGSDPKFFSSYRSEFKLKDNTSNEEGVFA